MKHFRKSFLTLLALTLFGGAGAWAQGPTAAEINSDLYSGWSSIDDELFKASELPGFQAVTEDQAKSWAGVPSTGIVVLYYEFVADGHAKYVRFVNGVYEGSYEENEFERYFIYEDIAYNGDKRYFYTTGGGAIELTKVGDNQWSLGQTPDYDLELQVEYYQKHALKNIPAGWTVKVNGTDKTAAIDGDSLMISETDSVTLVPDGNPRRVKSVTLTEVPSAVLVESVTLNKAATTILAGSTETLSVSSVTPDDATDQSVTWSSDNTDVATVGATTGEVTAVGVGTANITATANDGSGVTATCAVTVSKVVTINQSDWGSWDTSFTKDGVTVSADVIDSQDGNLMGGGTFSTTLGNFTKIVVTAAHCAASGTGWSGNSSSMTWAGTPASTVSFSDDFMGMGMGQTTIVCTIVPTN